MMERPRTVAIDETTKKKLDNMKITKRESYNDLILRLIDDWYKLKKRMKRKRGANKRLV